MEWRVEDEDGFMRRKYSNETMRSLKRYIDRKDLKSITEGYNEVLDRISVLINENKLRTKEEILEDRKAYKETL